MTPRARMTADGRTPTVDDRDDESLHVLAAVAVLDDEGRVLVMREGDQPFHGAWVLPQGYPRPGETLREAACREALEELGIDVADEALLGVYETFDWEHPVPPARWVVVCYRARRLGSAPLRASYEAVDFAWVDPAGRLPESPGPIQEIMADLARSKRQTR